MLLGLAQAPFAHTHRSDPDHQHATVTPHAHLPSLADAHATLEQADDDDDDAQSVDWVGLAAVSAHVFVTEFHEPFVVGPALVRYEMSPAPTPRGHDPPSLLSLPPRAPPV